MDRLRGFGPDSSRGSDAPREWAIEPSSNGSGFCLANKKRIDVLLTERGLAPSRQRAQSLLIAGKVLVDEVPVTKAGQLVDPQSGIRVRGQDHPYVSRGGIKLAAALDAFRVDPGGRIALDVGASTGGFTHALLLRGAERVIAIDVGHHQFDWKLRSDPRVALFEGVNARYLVHSAIGLEPGQVVGLIVIDVSFISLEKILPALIPFSDSETDWIALVKPQFEVGREHVGKGGIVTSDEARGEALERVIATAESLGLVRLSLIDSPITGTDGNKEFLVQWRKLLRD